MNRQEFMRQLEYLLRGVPENERLDALAYYNDYFDEAGAENEYQVIQELGSPEAVAQTILEDVPRDSQYARQDYCSPEMDREEGNSWNQTSYEQQTSQYENPYNSQMNRDTTTQKQGMSKSTKILLIIVLILTFPLWIGVVAGLFGGLVGLLGGLFGVVVGLGGSGIGMLIGGAACFVVGIMRVFTAPVEGLVTIAVGAILIALSLLLVVLLAWIVFKWLPMLFRAIVRGIKGLGKRQEGGDEI